jgi:hypothetical protein
MTNLIGLYDHTTGENVVREMTPEEQAQREIEAQAWIAAKEQRLAEANELRQTKIAAYEKLGLTAEEIEALLPTPKPRIIPQPSE